MQVRLEDVSKVAEQFLARIAPREDGATVVGFRGDLGAGKTTFTKAVAGALGVVNVVTSPTFVIMKHYETKHDTFKTLTHIDAYRMESGDDLTPLRFSELLEDKHRLIIVEWPEHVADALPNHTQFVDFKVIDETTRQIDFHE